MKIAKLPLMILVMGIGLAGSSYGQSARRDLAADKARKRDARQKLEIEANDLATRAGEKQGDESRALRRQAVVKRIMAEVLSEGATAPEVLVQIKELLADPSEDRKSKCEIERLNAMLVRKGKKFGSRTE